MTRFVAGLADELVKVALSKGPTKMLLERLRHSPELRRAIGRSAALGAGTGALTGAFSGDKDSSPIRRALAGAALGGAGGAVTGAVYPGWFGKHNRLAEDETSKPLSSALRHAGTLSALGSLANKAAGG